MTTVDLNTGGGAGTGPGGGAGTSPQGPPPPPTKYAGVFDLLVAELRVLVAQLDARGVDGAAELASRLAALERLGGAGGSLPARRDQIPTRASAVATTGGPGTTFDLPEQPPVPPFVAARRRLAELGVGPLYDALPPGLPRSRRAAWRMATAPIETYPDGTPPFPGSPPGPPPDDALPRFVEGEHRLVGGYRHGPDTASA
jgi:hypothetical protein